MTEEWDESWVTPLSEIWSNPDQMQWSFSVDRAGLFLKKHASDRRLRLFAVALCRGLHLDERKQAASAIETAEQFADEKGLNDRRARKLQLYEERIREGRGRRRRFDTRIQRASVMVGVLSVSMASHICEFLKNTYLMGRAEQLRILYEVFGNPFRLVEFSPEWRTTTAVAIAQGMYESRDFGPMPLLADALQDAGCETPEIIDHCRSPGPHVRGCWVVDGVLGKS